MAQVFDEKLTERASGDNCTLFVDARRVEFTARDIQVNHAPGRSGNLEEILEQLGRASAQRNEGDPHPIQAHEIFVGGEFGIKDEMAGKLVMSFLPESNKAEYFFGFFPFAQGGIGIAEGTAVCIVGNED